MKETTFSASLPVTDQSRPYATCAIQRLRTEKLTLHNPHSANTKCCHQPNLLQGQLSLEAGLQLHYVHHRYRGFGSACAGISQLASLSATAKVAHFDHVLHGKSFCWATASLMTLPVKCKTKTTRKRAIAKALQLEGHPDFEPVDLAYYQHFLGFFLFENIAFWEVPPGNHKCRARGATPLLNVK